jgi:hypothetical protein
MSVCIPLACEAKSGHAPVRHTTKPGSVLAKPLGNADQHISTLYRKHQHENQREAAYRSRTGGDRASSARSGVSE